MSTVSAIEQSTSKILKDSAEAKKMAQLKAEELPDGVEHVVPGDISAVRRGKYFANSTAIDSEH